MKYEAMMMPYPLVFSNSNIRQGCVAFRDCITCGKRIEGSCCCIVSVCPHCNGPAMNLSFDDEIDIRWDETKGVWTTPNVKEKNMEFKLDQIFDDKASRLKERQEDIKVRRNTEKVIGAIEAYLCYKIIDSVKGVAPEDIDWFYVNDFIEGNTLVLVGCINVNGKDRETQMKFPLSLFNKYIPMDIATRIENTLDAMLYQIDPPPEYKDFELLNDIFCPFLWEDPKKVNLQGEIKNFLKQPIEFTTDFFKEAFGYEEEEANDEIKKWEKFVNRPEPITIRFSNDYKFIAGENETYRIEAL